MRTSYRSRRDERKKKRKWPLFLFGFIVGMAFFMSLYEVSVYYSTDEACMSCHVHPHAEETWKLSSHVNNGSGVTVHCVDCHLPSKN